MRFSLALLPAIALLMGGTHLWADVITLNFTSLPSAQGWTYSVSATGGHAGQIETNIWNVNGTRLEMNTMGTPFASPSGNTYVRTGEVNAIDPIVVTWTSRVLLSEGFIPTAHYGWAVGFTTGSQQVAVGFQTNSIQLNSATPLAFNATTAFHDYRLEFTPGASTSTLFIDNVLFTTAAPDAVALNRIFFGDATGGANAQAHMTSYTFSQVPIQVPEPASLLLLTGVAGGAAGYTWRKRRAAVKPAD